MVASRKKAFTLVELLVVIAIIGVLALIKRRLVRFRSIIGAHGLRNDEVACCFSVISCGMGVVSFLWLGVAADRNFRTPAS